MPASRLKSDILSVMKKEGFIIDYTVVKDGVQGKISCNFKIH